MTVFRDAAYFAMVLLVGGAIGFLVAVETHSVPAPFEARYRLIEEWPPRLSGTCYVEDNSK